MTSKASLFLFSPVGIVVLETVFERSSRSMLIELVLKLVSKVAVEDLRVGAGDSMCFFLARKSVSNSVFPGEYLYFLEAKMKNQAEHSEQDR